MIDVVLCRDLQDMYIKKGQKDAQFHDEFVIRYINKLNIQRIYHLDNDTAVNKDTTNKLNEQIR